MNSKPKLASKWTPTMMPNTEDHIIPIIQSRKIATGLATFSLVLVIVALVGLIADWFRPEVSFMLLIASQLIDNAGYIGPRISLWRDIEWEESDVY